MNERLSLPRSDIRRKSFDRALDVATRLFAACDTKWPELLLPTALEQLESDLLELSLNCRRVLEHSEHVKLTQISPLFTELSGISASECETSSWKSMGMIIHHQVIEPLLLTDHNFYKRGETRRMSGTMVANVRVTSDRGTIVVNVPGLAIAVANDLGQQFKRAI